MNNVKSFNQYVLILESYSAYGLTEEEYNKIIMRVKRSVTKILGKKGFLASMLSQIPIAVSSECKYFSTDGTVFIFNPTNIKGMTDDDVMKALRQGVWHLALQHFDRKSGKDKYIWDLACDIAAESYISETDESDLPVRYKISSLENL